MFNLKYLREYEDYSMRQVAEKLHVAKSTYSNWELDIDVIPLKHLIDLINLYQVNLDFALKLTDKCISVNKVRIINQKVISKNLKELRERMKLTQEQFAKIAHSSRSMIGYYENERLLIPTSCLYHICKKFSISADELLNISIK